MTPIEITFTVIAGIGLISILLVLLYDRKVDKKEHSKPY